MTKTKRLFFLFFLPCVLLLVIFYTPSGLEDRIYKCYFTIWINLVCIYIVWLLIITKRKIDLFDPFVLATLIHILLFEISPLYYIFKGEMLWFNIDVWDGCIKGTWLSTIGYVSMAIGYFINFKIGSHVSGEIYREKNNNYQDSYLISVENCNDKIMMVSSCIWMFAFLSSVILIVTSGQNLKYMLTLKLSDSANSNELTRSSFQFLGVFAYMMVPSFLYILHFGKSKVFKIIVFYLMVMSFLIRGFRFILVAVIIAPVVMVYLIKRKRPKLSQLVILFIILLLMIGFVGFIRNGIRTGEGISSGFNTDEIEKAFFGNFEIFKTYYGIMKHIPKDLSYTYGQQIFLYTLIMFIPRALWPSKPEPITRSVITTSISAYANMAGTAYPYIGEYYHEFGVAGVIVGCFILGILLKKLSVYIFRIDIHSIILFSSVYPLILQVLIRGYMPSNFYMILFVVLPAFLLKYIDKTKYK